MDYLNRNKIDIEPEMESNEIQKAIKQQEYMQNYFDALEEMEEEDSK